MFSKTLKMSGDDYSRIYIYIYFKCRSLSKTTQKESPAILGFPVTCVRLLGYSPLVLFTPPGGCRSLCSPKFLLGWQA